MPILRLEPQLTAKDKTELSAPLLLVPRLTAAVERRRTIAVLSGLSGFIGVCLVDVEAGVVLASKGENPDGLEAAALANGAVLQAELDLIQSLGLREEVEDMLISLGNQYHLLRPVPGRKPHFLYLSLRRHEANLGLARIQIKKVAKTLAE